MKTYTLDSLTFGSESGFGRDLRTARTTEEWARVHATASAVFEDCYEREKQGIKAGASPSDEFLLLEAIVTLTHEVISTRRSIQALVRDLEGR